MSDKDEDAPRLNERQRQALRDAMERGDITRTDDVREAINEAREKGLMSGLGGGTKI